ncbi:hypothetical protein CTEN210_12550 [Chaetoceros tenuissimus]|uniref:VASt domain-containing protein n=1 Tax=Chaetoceros tenuissimus TaxID=426638 RepID=A0AAD3HAK8_9STRA|nr:hypothetical protein CTEN210_12550 [Chaetoceros tenuissimus]
MFGYERKIMIRIQELKHLSLHRSTSIRLLTPFISDQEDENEDQKDIHLQEYIFRSFRDRQQVISVIRDAYEKNTNESFQNQDLEQYIVKTQDGQRDFMTPLKKLMRKGSQARNDENRLDHESGDEASDMSPLRSRNSTLDESLSNYNLDEDDDHVADTVEKKEMDVKKEWTRVKELFAKEYSEVAVESRTLNVSMVNFLDTFIHDDASESIQKFQQDVIEDTDVQCSNWTLLHQQEGYSEFSRQLTANHMRKKARVGPSSVPLERRQVLKKFEKGFTIDTTLKLEGIPYGDTFEMHDRWLIESIDDNKINIEVRFKIHFIKTPMAIIRNTIMKQTRNEVSTWFTSYMEMVDSILGGDVQKKEAAADILPFDVSRLEAYIQVSITANLIFFVLILGLIAYVYILRHRVLRVENKIDVIAHAHKKMMEMIVQEKKKNIEWMRSNMYSRHG